MGQFMVAASDNDFGDPQNHPWTTGFGLDYLNESGMWASQINDEDPVSQRLTRAIKAELKVRCVIDAVPEGSLPRNTHKATRIVREN